MMEAVGFGENALVEREPGELSIDEAGVGMEVDRLKLDRPRGGSHFRSPDGCSKRILSRGFAPVMPPPDCLGRQPAGRAERAVMRVRGNRWVGDRLCIRCTCCGMPSRAGRRMLRMIKDG